MNPEAAEGLSNNNFGEGQKGSQMARIVIYGSFVLLLVLAVVSQRVFDVVMLPLACGGWLVPVFVEGFLRSRNRR